MIKQVFDALCLRLIDNHCIETDFRLRFGDFSGLDLCLPHRVEDLYLTDQTIDGSEQFSIDIEVLEILAHLSEITTKTRGKGKPGIKTDFRVIIEVDRFRDLRRQPLPFFKETF